MLKGNVLYFSLQGHEYIQLDNLLKITGISQSGGQARTLIASKQVKVDGEIELRKRRKLRINQHINVNDNNIIIQP